MRYLTVGEVLEIHAAVIQIGGGGLGLRDTSGLESAIAQPMMTFGGADLYPSVAEKASALGFSLIQNHPFVDGNKRVGHAAMEVFLMLNGWEISADVDEQESIIIDVASGQLDREAFSSWLAEHLTSLER
jgi:death on curing protein